MSQILAARTSLGRTPLSRRALVAGTGAGLGALLSATPHLTTPAQAAIALEATDPALLYTLQPAVFSSLDNCFDMLEGGQLSTSFSYGRDAYGPCLRKTGTGITIAGKAKLPNLEQHSFRFYVTYPTLPGGSTQLMAPLGTVDGVMAPIYRFVVTSSGGWRVHDAANTQKVWGTKYFTPGWRYRIEGQVTTTSITIRIYLGDSTVVWNEGRASGLSLGPLQVMRIGQLTSWPETTVALSSIVVRSDLTWIGADAATMAVATTADRVAIIGDSLTAMNGATGSNTSLAGRPIIDVLNERDFPLGNVTHYGSGGKKVAAPDQLSRTTMTNLADAVAALGGIDHAVIALGTNDASSADDTITAAVDQVVASAKAAKIARLTWIGAVYQAPRSATAARLNRVLSTALSRHTGIQVRFINPEPLIHDGRDETGWWVGDGTHMTPLGYATARASIYADAITT